MECVLQEEAAYDAFDDELAPDAHKLHQAVRALATPDAVPYLVSVVEQRGPGFKWAVHALSLLGEQAHSAAAALEAAGEWIALFRVDEARARQVGAHLRREPSSDPTESSVRAVIAEQICARGAWEARAHFAELLASDDDDLILFALDANPRDSSQLRRLAMTDPSNVPVAEVRRHLLHGNDEVVTAAARVLADLHMVADAERVLDVIGGRGITLPCAEWLGPLRESDALIPRAPSSELFELVRRRRCAGQPLDVQAVRSRVQSLLAPLPDPVRSAARNACVHDIGNAALIVGELRDVDPLDALVQAIGPREDGVEARFEDLTPTLVALGADSDRALAAARDRYTGERRERIGWMIDAIAKLRARVPANLVTLADKYFADGVLEDNVAGKSAYATYAQQLAREPTSGYCALQLAWIDRGFGTPITKERLAWLRELGVNRALLDELGRRPQSILHGPRSSHRHVREPDADRALQADQAGLWSIAAHYYGLKSRDGLRCLEATRLHLARARETMR
jgi:hypothetical protein